VAEKTGDPGRSHSCIARGTAGPRTSGAAGGRRGPIAAEAFATSLAGMLVSWHRPGGRQDSRRGGREPGGSAPHLCKLGFQQEAVLRHATTSARPPGFAHLANDVSTSGRQWRLWWRMPPEAH
jgi:hypothetical protein